MELEIINDVLDFFVSSKLIMIGFSFIVSLFVTLGSYFFFDFELERTSRIIYVLIFMITFLLCIGLLQLVIHFRVAAIVFLAAGGLINGIWIYAKKTDFKEAMLTFFIMLYMIISVFIIAGAFYYFF